ncbi:hypothetical protein N8550_01915 [Pirellulaceae bacterium]|nr:hypothetical protein [Pirellulaceae bacterium]
MLDRESTFADAEIIKTLQTKFVSVAIDQAYQRRQKDTEGDFYRGIAKDSPRGDGSNGGTTQGLYIATPDGKYLGYTNHRSPERIKKFIAESLAKFKPTNVDSIKPEKIDRRYHPVLPKGGLVVRVQARVLDGYEPTDNKWQKIFQSSLSRDNLWLTNKEHESIVNGVIPAKVQRRVARFHLVDNTRGEPPMWRDDEIKSINMKLENGKLTGNASLSTRDGSRTFDCDFYGYVKTSDGMITRFDVIALGKFFGEGTYTKNAPKGKFPLGISFTLADGKDVADPIPPQASRGWLDGYLKN